MSFLRRLSIAFGLEPLPEKKEFLVGKGESRTPQTTWEERVSPEVPIEKLEMLYKLDGLVFSAINRLTRSIVSPGFYFEGEEEYVKTIEDWCNRTKLKERLYPVVQDCFVAGRGWIELCYNKEETDIVKLINISPRTMDFIRSTMNKIIFTETGEALGYVHSPTLAEKKYFTVDKRKEVEGFSISSTSVFPKSNIGYFKFFSVGGSLLGMSPLEPL